MVVTQQQTAGSLAQATAGLVTVGDTGADTPKDSAEDSLADTLTDTPDDTRMDTRQESSAEAAQESGAVSGAETDGVCPAMAREESGLVTGDVTRGEAAVVMADEPPGVAAEDTARVAARVTEVVTPGVTSGMTHGGSPLAEEPAIAQVAERTCGDVEPERVRRLAKSAARFAVAMAGDRGDPIAEWATDRYVMSRGTLARFELGVDAVLGLKPGMDMNRWVAVALRRKMYRLLRTGQEPEVAVAVRWAVGRGLRPCVAREIVVACRQAFAAEAGKQFDRKRPNPEEGVWPK
jgi:hypothetical protein